jgi:hypothetical protein
LHADKPAGSTSCRSPTRSSVSRAFMARRLPTSMKLRSSTCCGTVPGHVDRERQSSEAR